MKRKIVVRLMTLSDVAEVALIAERIMPYAWSKAIFSSCFLPSYHNWVLMVDKYLVGFLITQCTLDQCEILNMGIDTGFQQQGLATILLTHLVTTLKNLSIKTIYLEVRISNQAAIAAYLRFGFVKDSVRKNYYPAEQGREHAVLMSYLL